MTRLRASALIVAAVAIGLVSRKVHIGNVVWDKYLGDALYAVMVLGFAALVRPTARATQLGAIAFVTCLALELFQLTGIPKTLPPLLRAAIGDTFSWADVAGYAAGAIAGALVARLWRRPDETARPSPPA